MTNWFIADRVHDHAGSIAAGVSVSSTIVSFIAAATPVIQFLAACVALISGILSVIWLALKIHHGPSNKDD